MNASPLTARPAYLLDTVLSLSLTAMALLQPVYAADGTLQDFTWAYLNPAGQRLLQQPAVPAGSLRTLFPTALQDGVFTTCCQAYLTGEPQRHETNYQADGLDGYFVLVVQRHEELLVVNFTDTNEQARTPVEQALRESQAREQAARAAVERERSLLQALLTQAPVALALFQGEEVRVATVNDQMAAIWGRTPEAVLNRPLLEGVPELQGQGFDELLRQVLRTKEPVSGQETPATMLREGQLQTTYYNFVYQPLLDAHGAVLGVIDVAVDVTEQVLARQALEQLNRELETRVQQRTRELEQRTQQLQQLTQELEARVQQRTREAEAARATAERQRGELQRIFEQAPVAIAVYRGPRYVIELANTTVARLWGRTQEQLIGKGLFEALPEVAGMGYEQLLDEVMATGQPHVAHAMEAQHDRNGQRETVYWDFVYVPMYGADGRINGAMVVANEVTAQVVARRQLEQHADQLETQVQQRTRQLTQQSQRLARLVQEAPAAIALLDGPQLVFELLNADYQALFPGRELLGRPVLEALPELRSTPLAEILQQVHQTGTTFEGYEFPLPLVGADGQEENRYFDFIYQARYDVAGGIDGLVVFGFDVTERVRRRRQTEVLQAQLLAAAEQRAQQRQDLYRLFEQAPAAIVLLREPDHQIDYCNPAFAQLFPGENLRGRTVADAYPQTFGSPIIARLDRVYQSGETYYGMEVALPVASYPDRPSQPRYFNFTYQAYREQECIVGVALFFYEVTEQVLAKQQVLQLHEALALTNEELAATNEELTVSNEEYLNANTRLVRSNADLDSFVYSASHDLKAPITNIEGLLHALRQELPTELVVTPMIGQVLRLMEDAIARFQQTLGHLTHIVQLERVSADPTEVVDLALLIQAVCLDLAPAIEATKAEIVVDPPAGPFIEFAPKGLRSIIFNLLSNALKYHYPGRVPRVVVRSTCHEGHLRLLVQDNGLGLTPAQQGQLFQLFRRLHPGIEGSGVGLYAVKKIVDNAGGTITVQSSIGVGTLFTVVLSTPLRPS